MAENGSWVSVVSTIRTYTAANPLLTALVIVMVICTPASHWAAFPLNIIFAGLDVLIVSAFVLQILFFTFTDPNRLQGEKHLQAMARLNKQIGYRDGDTMKQVTVSLSDDLVQNPKIEQQ